MVLDDLQWADQASVDLLIHLLKLAEEVPILFIFAFRPERQSPAWQVKQTAETDYPASLRRDRAEPLDAADTDALVSALLNITDLPAELRQLIMRKTDGNPYFVEEVVRTPDRAGLRRRRPRTACTGRPAPSSTKSPSPTACRRC